MGKRRVLFVLAELLIITFFLTGAMVTASVTTIDNSTTIAGAIAAAAPGDTIILEPGIYFENEITIDRNITIRANTSYGHDASDTIIDALYLGRVFFNSAGNTLTIDNLTIQNTLKSNQGGAISNEGTLIVISSSFTRCTVSPDPRDYEAKGGAISNEGTLTVTGSTFTDCSAQTSPYMSTGGAIFNRGTATITSSVFNNCHSEEETYDIWGGAILNWWGCTLTVTSSEFNGCSAPGGGAIHVMGGTATISGSTFTGCSAAEGGAIYSEAPLTITDTTFSGCSATGKGGAIYATGATTAITDTTFSGCTAGSGGAIYLTGGSASIGRTAFTGCSAVFGGAIFHNGGTVTLTTSEFTSCPAGYQGGAIFNNQGTATITYSTFSDCSADLVSPGSTGSGGAIYNIGTTTITSSTFSGCSAASEGGAISNSGSLTMHFSRIVDCGSLEAYSNGVTADAENNWWGTNAGPAAFIAPSINADPWLIFGITADPSAITTGQPSVIRANLTFGSDGVYHNPAGGHVPDDITNLFSIESGSGSVLPLTAGTINGLAETTFTPAGTGTTVINATVDSQSVYITVPVTAPVPAITTISPSTGPLIGGTMVTITGSGFLGTTGASAVTFGSTPSPSYSVDSDTQIRAVSPEHAAGTVDIQVTAPGGTTTVVPADRFTYTAVPVTPSSGSVSSGDDDFPPAIILPMTVTVNIGGDSKAWQAIVTGTKLSGLIVTGTVQPGPGSNVTAPPGTVFQYISLVPARYNTITKAVINFTIPQSWLDENHIDPKSIVLYHQTANGWQALPTTVLSTKDGTVFFSAQSTGFSLFAIAGTPSAITPTTVATTQGVTESIVQTPAPVAVTQVPVTTQTTAPPAATPKPAAPSPLLNIVLVIAAIGVLAGGGFMARRWWIRRQNPALFREYD